MCEPASYFEQEAAAISEALGPGSPATSLSPAGSEPAVWIVPSCQPCPCPGVASLPAFLQTLPSACHFAAFIFSLNVPQAVMQKGRK